MPTQRRVLKRNADLGVTAWQGLATRSNRSCCRYLRARHPDGGMVEMDEHDFLRHGRASPVNTLSSNIASPGSTASRRLVGACLTDQQADGLSMIYSFFEPDEAGRAGLGTYIILDHIVRAGRAGLPYVYLGYWVEEAKRMAYKSRFRPIERLGPGGWRRFDPEQRELPLG